MDNKENGSTFKLQPKLVRLNAMKRKVPFPADTADTADSADTVVVSTVFKLCISSVVFFFLCLLLSFFL